MVNLMGQGLKGEIDCKVFPLIARLLPDLKYRTFNKTSLHLVHHALKSTHHGNL